MLPTASALDKFYKAILQMKTSMHEQVKSTYRVLAGGLGNEIYSHRPMLWYRG